MNTRKAAASVVAVILAIAGFARGEETPAPTNVIVFIGDGMGIGVIGSAEISLSGIRKLVIPTAPVTGLLRTPAVDRLIPDSAAAGTALATGFRTAKGVVGQLCDGTPVRNILEVAHDQGKATGVITTSCLVDATPACFTVHSANRHDYSSILRSQLASPFDVMIGGDCTHYSKARRAPGYLEDLAQAERLAPTGTTVVRSADDLTGAPGRLVALYPPRPHRAEQHGPPLDVSVRAALDRLSTDSEGFFLMVENEDIDERAHDNDFEAVVDAVRELDETVAVVLEFAKDHPDTLVIVTADHDTGGLAVTGGTGPADVETEWIGDDHTALWVPLFAWGPGADSFSGVHTNVDFARTLGGLLGFRDFPATVGEGHH